MTLIKVGFVAHGPASANSLKPIIDVLEHSGNISIHLFAYHEYVSTLWGTNTLNTKEGYHSDLYEMDIIVYGTGSGNPLETDIPQVFNPLNNVTISILDLFHLEHDNLKIRFPTNPNYLIVQDIKSLMDARKVVGHSCQILTYGNPHFDRLSPYVKQRSLPDKFSVAFFSQCSTNSDYSEISDGSLMALRSLITYRNNNPDKITSITLKPHPREDPTFIKEYCYKHDINYVETDSLGLMLESDFIYGHTCTLQLEALLIGKPTSLYNRHPLAEVIEHFQNNKTVPFIETFNSTFKCVNLITDIVDELLNTKLQLNN